MYVPMYCGPHSVEMDHALSSHQVPPTWECCRPSWPVAVPSECYWWPSLQILSTQVLYSMGCYYLLAPLCECMYLCLPLYCAVSVRYLPCEGVMGVDDTCTNGT